MSICLPRERAAVHNARDACLDSVEVCAAEAVAPAISPTGRFALEILLDPAAGGVPPHVAELLADRGLTIRRIHRGGDCWRALATA
jgi:hypothetical protein